MPPSHSVSRSNAIKKLKKKRKKKVDNKNNHKNYCHDSWLFFFSFLQSPVKYIEKGLCPLSVCDKSWSEVALLQKTKEWNITS